MRARGTAVVLSVVSEHQYNEGSSVHLTAKSRQDENAARVKRSCDSYRHLTITAIF